MSSTRTSRREDWGMAIEIEEGLWRIRLLNPYGALMVNTYVYRTPTVLAVIDPGWPWTLDLLEQALVDLGLARSFDEVSHWIYTHTHIDHMGGAALLADRSDAPHIAWSGAEELLEQWHAYQDRVNDWSSWIGEAFANPLRDELVRGYRERLKAREREFMLPMHGARAVQNAELYGFGERVRVGDLELEVVDARGHDPFHVAFFEPNRKWLFVGDAIIATPTPISRAMDDDLSLYRASLERLARLPAEMMMPGHGIHRTGDLARAFARSHRYVDQYRDEVIEQLATWRAPVDLHTLALEMTPNGRALQPSDRWWVHIALIDSHLQDLVSAGIVERSEGPRYSL